MWFKYERVTKCGNNFAVSSDGLATALQTSASALHSAGNDLNQSVALVAAANKVIQDPSQVGAALRTIALRIRGTSVEVLQEMGEETDGVVESVSKLQQKVMAITGVNILDESGAYKDTYEILKELAKVWDKVGQKDPKGQAALLELLAGKNRSNALAAILGNFEDLEDAYDTALKAEGSAQRELDTHLNSIQGRIDKFTNAVQTMWMNLISSDLIKGVVDFGTLLINIFDTINQTHKVIGPLTSLSIIIGVIVGVLKGFPALIGKIQAATSASNIAKKESANQTSVLSTAIKEESASRAANTAATNAETAALKANTAAQIENNRAKSGEVFDIDIGEQISFDDLGKGAYQAADKADEAADAVKNVAEAAEELTDDGQIPGQMSLFVEAIDDIGEVGTKTGGKLKNLGSSIVKFFKGPIGTFALVAAAIAGVVWVVDKLTVSFKEAKQKFEETSEALNTVETEIDSLNEDLKENQKRIDELLAKDTLTIIEQEELEKLEQTNAELERNLKLQEREAEILRNQKIKDAVSMYEKDDSFRDKYVFAETVDQTPSYAKNKGIGFNNSQSYAANAPSLPQMENVGTEFEQKLKAAEEYQAEVEDLTKKEEELYNAWKKAEADNSSKRKINSSKKAYEEAKKAREDAEIENKENLEILSQIIAERQALYSDLEWQTGEVLTEDQKRVNEILTQYNNDINRYLIATDTTGKAIFDALKEIANRPMFDGLIEEVRNMSVGDFNTFVHNDDEAKAFIESLKQSGIIANTSYGEIEKLYNMLLQTSEATEGLSIADKKLARSQKRLEYYKKYKELNKYTKGLVNGAQKVEDLTDTQKKHIATLKEELAVLAAEISQYDILGDQIEEAKAAFDNFETAQTADAESDRLESAGDMFKAIIDGFHSAELGSETFKAAMAGLVPESVYADLDTLEAKYDAVWNYMNQDLNKYFTLEFDDEGLLTSVETTTADVERFIQDAKSKGLMSFADGIWDVNETDFSKFAEKMNLTESALYALLVQMDKIDADWIMGDGTSVFDSFDKGAETILAEATMEMANLEIALAEGTIGVEEFQERYSKAQEAVVSSTENALDKVIEYNEAARSVEEARAKLEEATTLGSDGKIDSQENINSIIALLSEAMAKKAALEEPGELMLTVARDQLDIEMAALEQEWISKLNSGAYQFPLLIEGEVNSKYIQEEVDKETGQITYKITPEVGELPEAQRKELERYAELLNTEVQYKLYDENEENAKTQLEEVDKLLDDLYQQLGETPGLTLDNSKAKTALDEIKKQVDQWLAEKDDKVVTITYRYETEGSPPSDAGDTSTPAPSSTPKRPEWYSPGTTYWYQGTAHANGDWGLKRNEKNALVGELGQETVVDPHTGRYYTVGDNGAEFVDLPKDAIIFNHRQTEELFKNGHINSRGKAYANGNAYTSGTLFDKYKNGAIYGVTGNGKEGASDVSSKSDDQFEELFDWFEILVEEMDRQTSLMEAQLENAVGIDAKKGIYSGLISAEYIKMDAFTKGIDLYTEQANKFLAKIPEKYKELAQDGGIAITEFAGDADEKTVEAIKNYREWADKAKDLNQQLEETKARISDLRVETQNMIATEYDNKIGLITNLNDILEAEMGLLEEKGERSSDNFYNEMIKNGEDQLKQLEEKRNKMQAELDDAVKKGDVKKGSDDWYEMVNAIYDVDAAIIDCETDIEGFNNSIQELHWENFEKIIDQISAVSDEAEQLRDLIGDDNLVDELVPEQWTADGVTALGLVAQQMENAQYRAQLYAEEIEYLNEEYKKGNYSQDEYNEKLKELKDGQWDAIDAYESAKDAIVDLNKARVDAIKDGIQKEIDAYEELINKRKEDLDAQKDAHDWANTVADHTKNIDAIQRQIDAMEGDNSAAAVAQRKKLQEELAAAQEEYDEALYDRSIETQKQSLDKDFERNRAAQEAKMEALDEWLKNEEQVIAASYDTISANTEAIHSNIEAISDKYGIEIENNVVEPWTAGITALGTYETELDTSTSKYVEMLARVREELVNLQLQADDTADSIINATNEKATQTQAAVQDPKPSRPSSSGSSSGSRGHSGGGSSGGNNLSAGDKVVMDPNATHWDRDGGNGTKMHGWVPGSEFEVLETSKDGSQVLVGIDGKATGWVDKDKVTEKYAKGTTRVKSNQLAWIDENGLEEIVMHAENGRLAYLTKGSSVIPHDISENLMELGKVDPRTWMESNRKTSVPQSFVMNNNKIDLNVGSLIHIEHADRDSIPDIQAAVQKQLDGYMKNINAGLKRYTR